MFATQKNKLPLTYQESLAIVSKMDALPYRSDSTKKDLKRTNGLEDSLEVVGYSERLSAFSIFKKKAQQPIKTEDVVCRIFD